MSNDNVTLDSENTTTTTRFQQTKTKVSEFIKKHKRTIGIAAGSTALIGLGAAVHALTRDEDDDTELFELSFSPDDHDADLAISVDGETTLYAELESDGDSIEIDETADTVTESTE